MSFIRELTDAEASGRASFAKLLAAVGVPPEAAHRRLDAAPRDARTVGRETAPGGTA